MKKILITGGAGYIGSVMADLALGSGFKVRVMDLLWFNKDLPRACADNPSYEFIRADICDTDSLRMALEGVDIVVHAAAVVGEPATNKFSALTTKINLEASIRLIEEVRNSSAKGIIFLSTCSNYGIADGIATEDSPLKPLSLYAKTKVGVERYLMDKTKGLDWVICRLSTVYGVSPRMRFDLTVNDFTLNALINRYLEVFLPYTHRPYIHVSDVARIILEAVNNFNSIKHNVFNIGFNTENYQKIRIAEIIKGFIPDLDIRITEKGIDIRDYRVDFSDRKSVV